MPTQTVFKVAIAAVLLASAVPSMNAQPWGGRPWYMQVGRTVPHDEVPAQIREALAASEPRVSIDAVPAEARAKMPFTDPAIIVSDRVGGFWIGGARGAAWWDGKEWRYRQSRRWLPDDHVQAIFVDDKENAWFQTPAGIGLIERRPMSLFQKARFFEDEIARRHRRTDYGYVLEATLKRPGDLAEWANHDSDNDGLWTGMYGAAQCFAYAALNDPAAKKRATRALRALAFLSEVTQGGPHPAPPGFPARSILPASGPDPNIQDSPERDRQRQQDGDKKWKLLAPRWPKSADGKWYWKTDTSSDELDGHYFLYALYYDLAAETEPEKSEVRAVVRRVTDHLLAHDYALVDHDGKATRWAVFGPEVLNYDPTWWVERGLNSLSILTYLRIASHITGDSRYGAAADLLIRRQGYANNLMFAKATLGVGGGNQSDDEMAFMNYYHLMKFEKNPKVRSMVAMSLNNYWQLERPERNPFFNFVAASQLKGMRYEDAHDAYDLSPTGNWLEESKDTLRRFPLNLIEWPMKNSHREDLVPIPDYIRPDAAPGSLFLRSDGGVIPIDERVVFHWNLDPFRVDSGGSGLSVGDGTSFLLPYYMGLYEGFYRE